MVRFGEPAGTSAPPMNEPSGLMALAVSSCMPPRSTPAAVIRALRSFIPVAAVQRNATELFGMANPLTPL
jgi:hypothetical protein